MDGISQNSNTAPSMDESVVVKTHNFRGKPVLVPLSKIDKHIEIGERAVSKVFWRQGICSLVAVIGTPIIGGFLTVIPHILVTAILLYALYKIVSTTSRNFEAEQKKLQCPSNQVSDLNFNTFPNELGQYLPLKINISGNRDRKATFCTRSSQAIRGMSDEELLRLKNKANQNGTLSKALDNFLTHNDLKMTISKEGFKFDSPSQAKILNMNDSEFKRLINDAKKRENTHLKEAIIKGLDPNIKKSLITLDKYRTGLSEKTKKLIDCVGAQKCYDTLTLKGPKESYANILYQPFLSYLVKKGVKPERSTVPIAIPPLQA